MIKKHLKTMVITSLVTLLPILPGLVLWSRLPQELPTHWNLSGEVDRSAGKAMVVLGMPLMLLALQWLLCFLLSVDPKRRNHSEKLQALSLWIVPVLCNVVLAVCYATAMGHEVMVNVLVPMLIGLLFVLIGNYLPKCKQNYTIGFKIPWTLNSEENWNRTHRVAGWTMVVGGITVMLIGCTGLLWAILPVMLAMLLVPLCYSYCLYKKGI